MKLKSLAALLVRIIGVVFLLGGVALLQCSVLLNAKWSEVVDSLESIVLGAAIIFFSKKLGGWLCRGLEE